MDGRILRIFAHFLVKQNGFWQNEQKKFIYVGILAPFLGYVWNVMHLNVVDVGKLFVCNR